MKKLPTLLFPAAGLLLMLAACQTLNTVPPVTPALVSAGARTGASASDLEAGRQFYAGKCTSCHSAVSIGRHSAGEWPGILEDMAKKSKLDAAQSAQVRAYVFAVLDAPGD